MKILSICASLFLMFFFCCRQNEPAPVGGAKQGSLADNVSFIRNTANQVSSDSTKAGHMQLDSADFAINDISTNITTETLTSRFGKPDSISSYENPFENESRISTWHYKDISFTFTDDSSCLGFTVTGKGFSTKRGLKVGDPVSRVLKLYGKKAYIYHKDYEYLDPEDGLHIIRIITSRGKVKEIYLGYILD